MVINFALRSSLLVAVTTTAACSMFWEVPATPLHDAAWKGDVAAITRLVKNGADINEADDMGATALYWAARGGHRLGPHQCKGEDPGRPEVIATMIALGADPNIQDRRPKGFGRSSGWTPLFVALHHEQFMSARVMLEHGADPNILSDQGVSVIAAAAAEGAPKELVALIVEKGFDPQKTRRRPPIKTRSTD
jgi:ankyrin repeat protein